MTQTDSHRYAYNCVLLNFMAWQPTINTYQRLCMQELRDWNNDYLRRQEEERRANHDAARAGAGSTH